MRIGIRHRITLVFTAVLVVVLASAGLALILKVRSDLRSAIDTSLRSRADVLKSAGIGAATVGSLIEKDESFAQIIGPGGSIEASSAPFTPRPLLSDEVARAVQGPSFYERELTMGRETFPARLLAVRLEEERVLVVGSSLEDQEEVVGVIGGSLLVGGPILAAIGGFIIWSITGAALRPVTRLREEAEALSISEVGRPLHVADTGDEIQHLGESLNALLARLADAFEKEREFLDEASHELRTPVTTLRAELELALAHPSNAEQMRAAVQRALSDADHLMLLTEDLLVLARTDKGRLPLKRIPTDLPELVSQIAAGFKARADAAACTIAVAVEGSYDVDPLRIRQVLNNLIDNAIRHGGSNNKITVSGVRDGDGLLLVVEDGGPGFPQEVLDGPAEAKLTAGSGMGLRIVRAITEAHGGSVELSDVAGGGARVALRVPASSCS